MTSMSDLNRGYARPIPMDRADMSVDTGLRTFMLGVYNKVALGLLLSAALAYLTSSFAPVQELLFRTVDGRFAGMTILGMIVSFAPLAVILFSGFAIRNPTEKSAGITYWTIVSLMGASLGVVMLVYTGASVVSTFLVTATAFGALSLIGYTTKKDLTAFGSFLIIGLVGLILASVVNMFLKSSAMAFIVNIIGVLIFAGLIAYDTQRLKMSYYELGGDKTAMGVATNFGALSLYLNFINLFQFLLSILGDRR
jgi:FtsH-binding integral membrane protein